MRHKVQGAARPGFDCPARPLRQMRGLQPLRHLPGLPKGRPDADSGGPGPPPARVTARHGMKPAPTRVRQVMAPGVSRRRLESQQQPGLAAPLCGRDAAKGGGWQAEAPAPQDRRRHEGAAKRTLSLLLALILFLSLEAALFAQSIPYQRPVETAPQENTIGGSYHTPPVQKPLPRDRWLQVLDVLLLAAAMRRTSNT